MTTTEKTYTLQGLSERQMRVLTEALELHSRLGMGQIEYLMEAVRFGLVTDREGKPLGPHALDKGDASVRGLKEDLTGFAANASKGIGNPNTPESAQIAWEIFKVIRHHLAWEANPQGGVQVHFDNPHLLKYTSEPWIRIETDSQPENENEPQRAARQKG